MSERSHSRRLHAEKVEEVHHAVPSPVGRTLLSARSFRILASAPPSTVESCAETQSFLLGPSTSLRTIFVSLPQKSFSASPPSMAYLCFLSPAPILPRLRPCATSKCNRSNTRMGLPRPSAGSSNVATPDEWDLQLGSPCKINLFLRVMGKRPDGYHEIASLFQAISLRDTISFSRKKDADADPMRDTLECDARGVPTDDSNLVIKALNKFRERTGTENFFRIKLEKGVPHEAGLGGGSANAATALWAANLLSGKPCTTEELAQFGAEFGSDISFFLSNGSAYCTGRGEVLEEIPRLRPQTLYLVKPKEGLSTSEVFKNLDLSQCSKKDPRELLEKMQNGVIFADFVNDLEAPSFKLMPKLGELKAKLYEAGFNVVLMSGSGTSFFCLGQPSSPDFMKVFPVENEVQIFEALFHGRRFPDMWYFEYPPLTPKKKPNGASLSC